MVLKVLLIIFLLESRLGTGIAQQGGIPHIGYLFPSGGQTGTTFNVKIGGQFLDGVTHIHISNRRVQAKVLDYTKPLTQQQANALRDRLKDLLEQKRTLAKKEGRPEQTEVERTDSKTSSVWTLEMENTLVDIRRKLAQYQKRAPNPALAETVNLEISIPSGIESGDEEFRLVTPRGFSNPLLFCIGTLPQFIEPQLGTNDEPKENVFLPTFLANKAVAPNEMQVTVPAKLNGQIMPGGVDRYRFHAEKGRSVIARARARSLMPYLADAVPGWFQAVLRILDIKGNELGFSSNHYFQPDPMLRFDVPEDGDYVLEIHDSLYRGREDFVYQVTIGDIPFINSHFPLGGRIGTTSRIDLIGFNLPTSRVVRTNQETGIQRIFLNNSFIDHSIVPFAVDVLPESLEQGTEHCVSSPQTIEIPILINGRIRTNGERDAYVFHGKAGDQIIAEVIARRLGSPLDSILIITDSKGMILGENDDWGDKSSGLLTHHADSLLQVTIPSSGKYILEISDAQNHAGLEYSYRLRVNKPIPDFELSVVPSGLALRPGMSAVLQAHVVRKNGFTNEIQLRLKDGPASEKFQMSGALIPANQNEIRMTIASSVDSAESVSISNLELVGRAILDGKEVVHSVVACEDMMQAFAYHHLVPAKELVVAVMGKGFPGRSGISLSQNKPFQLPAGGTASVHVRIPGKTFADRFQLELDEAPDGISLENVSATNREWVLSLAADPTKVKPGMKGNLIVGLIQANTLGSDKRVGNRNGRGRTFVGVLPAIAYEIIDASGDR